MSHRLWRCANIGTDRPRAKHARPPRIGVGSRSIDLTARQRYLSEKGRLTYILLTSAYAVRIMVDFSYSNRSFGLAVFSMMRRRMSS